MIAEFATYMHYCRSLRFEDRPDYAFLKKMFKELMVKHHHEFDFVFDWTFVEAPKIQAAHLGGKPAARELR
jgi:casein kinase 1